jgi:hypothetical protein
MRTCSAGFATTSATIDNRRSSKWNARRTQIAQAQRVGSTAAATSPFPNRKQFHPSRG